MSAIPISNPTPSPRFPVAYVKHQARRFWGARANRWIVTLASLWFFVISIPFLFLGVEGWAPIWYYLAQPFATWLKQVYSSGGVVAYVGAITLLSALMWLIATCCTWWAGVATVKRVRQWKNNRRASAG